MTTDIKASDLAADLHLSVSDLLYSADRIIQKASDPAGLSTYVKQAKNEASVLISPRLADELRRSMVEEAVTE